MWPDCAWATESGAPHTNTKLECAFLNENLVTDAIVGSQSLQLVA